MAQHAYTSVATSPLHELPEEMLIKTIGMMSRPQFQFQFQFQWSDRNRDY